MQVTALSLVVLLLASVTTALQENTDLETSCITENPIYTEGTCMLSGDCTKSGGIASGTCAQGLETCCISQKTCNEETSVNNTYFMSPEHGCTGTCLLTVNKVSSDICQIRLDFINFNISQPVNDGECRDMFIVQGGLHQTPVICGYNTGQHMYINVDPIGGPIKIILQCDSTISFNREWNIKVSQISCESRYRAPENCLQYYTEISGNVWSLNYPRSSAHSVIARNHTWQLSNQNYAVCVQNAPGFCGITWESDSTDDYSFTITDPVSAIGPFLGDPAACNKGADLCPNDYVIIPEGVDDTGEQADRYCGLGFPNMVTSESSPFILRYRTNDAELPNDDGNRGFSLIYHQNYCYYL